MIRPSCTREKKKREKNVIALTRSCRFHIMSKPTAWRGIRSLSSSVLKSSACKFSDEKRIQIVVTPYHKNSICLENSCIN